MENFPIRYLLHESIKDVKKEDLVKFLVRCFQVSSSYEIKNGKLVKIFGLDEKICNMLKGISAFSGLTLENVEKTHFEAVRKINNNDKKLIYVGHNLASEFDETIKIISNGNTKKNIYEIIKNEKLTSLVNSINIDTAINELDEALKKI